VSVPRLVYGNKSVVIINHHGGATESNGVTHRTVFVRARRPFAAANFFHSQDVGVVVGVFTVQAGGFVLGVGKRHFVVSLAGGCLLSDGVKISVGHMTVNCDSSGFGKILRKVFDRTPGEILEIDATICCARSYVFDGYLIRLEILLYVPARACVLISILW
jgi:hypothetical protein